MAGVLQGAGLGVAVLAVIPTIGSINRGRHGQLIGISTAASVIGLTILALCGSSILPLVIGILFMGIGYVLLNQTTTAWAKNLYPEDSRGQFEGVRIVFVVLIPMILGPSAANIAIANWGVPVTIDGAAGLAPSSALFWLAAVIMVLVLVPAALADRNKSNVIR